MLSVNAAEPHAPSFDPAAQAPPSGPAFGAGSPAPPPRKDHAAETLRLYASDWDAFVAWRRTRGAAPLPAQPAEIAAWLLSLASRLSHGALVRRAAAIAHHHRRQALPSPCADPAVAAILAQARKRRAPRRNHAPSAALLQGMAAACAGDRAGLRDRALLLLAAAGLGRAALVGLDVEHVRFTADGVELAFLAPGPQSRCGKLLLSRQSAGPACPARALEDWLRTSDTRFGPVFRKVDRWGNVEHRRLGADAVRRVLARHALRRRRPPAAAAP